MWYRVKKQITTASLIVTLLFTAGYGFVPAQKAEAIGLGGGLGGPVTVAADVSATNVKTSIESTISAAADVAQQTLLFGIQFKELTADGIAFILAKHLLKGVTNSILNWINSGFQGSPAFVTDFDGFLLELADGIAGEFIYGTQLGFLCSPFQLDVRIGLEVSYQGQRFYEPVCTLSDISNNIEGFLAGDFTQGGWPGWFEITQNPTNNAAGAYLGASAALDIAIQTAEGRRITLLEANDFFLNVEICDEAHSSEGNRKNCTTTTPGKIISEHLTFTIQGAERSLIEADEINEIVGALFAQLAQQAITGTYGLLGLGGSSYSSYDSAFGSNSNLSYLRAIEEEDQQLTLDQVNDGDIVDAIRNEEENIGLQTQIITRVAEVAEDYLQVVEQFLAPNPATADGTPPILTCPGLQSNTIDRLLNRLIDHQDDAVAERAVSNENIILLNGLLDRLNTATSSEDQLVVLNEFLDLYTSNELTNESDLARTEFFLGEGVDRNDDGVIEYGLEGNIFDFEDEYEEVADNCRTF